MISAMYQTWLLLLSLFSCVSAFYPYDDQTRAQVPKRSYTVQNLEPESSAAEVVRLDLHKIEV